MYIANDFLYDSSNEDQKYWIDKNYHGWECIVRPLIEECHKRGHTIMQIKAKFGSLRFYWHDKDANQVVRKDQEFINMVNLAESRSFNVCARCGYEDEQVAKNTGVCNMCKDNWLKILEDEMSSE